MMPSSARRKKVKTADRGDESAARGPVRGPRHGMFPIVGIGASAGGIEESRDRYADLYDFAPVGYVDLDETGLVRAINLTGAAMLGVPRESLAGRSFTRFVAPGDRDRFLSHLRGCLLPGGNVTTEVTLRPKGGPPFPVELRSVRSHEEGLASCRTAISDIRARRKAEDALRESEERFRCLVKDSLVGILIVQDGRIAFMNPEQERLLGPLPASQKVGDFEGVHPEDREAFLSLCGAPGGGRPPEKARDIRILDPPGGGGARPVRWVHCRGSRVALLGKAAVLVNMIDISRAKELERAALVQQKLASLGHVAAGIAHEIRNPLSGINIYASTVSSLCDRAEGLSLEEKERIRSSIEQMVSASDKIAAVIQKVMDFAKPVPPRLEPVDVNRAIEEVLELCSMTLSRHRIEVATSLSPDLPMCRADLRLIVQVLLNLVANADQAMEGLGGRKRLGISSLREGGSVVVAVSDSGPGVPPHLREKIFDPYFTTKADGTGIGLSFSHRVVTDHGGSLRVLTSEWGGAEFRVEIPVAGKGTHG